MKHNQLKKVCSVCKNKMWKHGKTKQGKVRWYCKKYKVSGIRKRKDVSDRKGIKLLKEWIFEGKKLRTLAKDFKLSKEYVWELIDKELKKFKVEKKSIVLDKGLPLVLDGTSLSTRKLLVLIAHDTTKVLYWDFVERENFLSWSVFLERLEGTPLGIVSDAQKGLLKAVYLRFHTLPHQRCVAHVVRQSKTWLTQRPKTELGKDLLDLVKTLALVKEKAERGIWIKRLQKSLKEHELFLKERTYGEGKRWWYTHKKLRAVKSLLLNALPNLFLYLDYDLPNTSNHLEGGINSPLKFLFKEHRGLSLEHKIQVTNLYLQKKSGGKNQH